MRHISWSLRALAGWALTTIAGPALAGDAYTTRIEPRAVYGATVTVEEGVRVFRPLPSEQHVIVNPGGKTPLFLGYYDQHGHAADQPFAPGAYAVPMPVR